eukprot:Mrub_03796.p1 GENE.Mrub_03796~~Mrub_03796.p1  ORF type:complete len:429 (-),score=116.96 Mrub_03796:96-1283(-)
MQGGFGMLELGTVRSKNAVNILMKNVIDLSLATFCWFSFGYGFAYGDSINDLGILGFSQFFGVSDLDTYYRDWSFQWAFAGTAATIVSGSLAERCYMNAYIICSCFMTLFIYPVVVHWTWGGGWLASMGYADFAGSGVVHLVGGTCGLVGAVILGPRLDRFDPEKADEFKPHNTGYVTLGALILWFGWYGFNAGSALGVTGDNTLVVQVVSVNTSISCAASGLTVFYLAYAVEGRESITSLINGSLAGLVGITAGCDAANFEFSLLIGVVSGLLYYAVINLFDYLRVDDPLDAYAVHGANGIWGTIASALARVYLHGDDMSVLYANLIGCVVISAWTALCAGIIFGSCAYFGCLRVTIENEHIGLDKVFHGHSAYQLDNAEYYDEMAEVQNKIDY